MIQRWGLDSVRRFSRELEGVARLLGVSVQALDRLHVDSRIQESEVLEAGWLRFHYMLRHSDTAGSRGSYVNWISRLMLEEAVDRGEAFRLDSMFEKLHAGCGLAEWERLGAELFPDYDIFTASKVTGSRPPFAPVYAFSFFRQVESLPIHPDARRALRQFLRHQDEIPEGVLPRLTQHLRAHPEFVSSVEEALAVARKYFKPNPRSTRMFWSSAMRIFNCAPSVTTACPWTGPSLAPNMMPTWRIPDSRVFWRNSSEIGGRNAAACNMPSARRKPGSCF
ncbi:MAG: hypothetical protein K8R69_07685 [Deltaproteobacteria bacterium]|nr:hypothetical protein [Deltaproteobacteria bacterium]